VLVRPGLDGEWRALVGSHEWADPRLSPDGTKVAFVLAGELHVLDTGDPTATAQRLTFDASLPDAYGDQAITNGLAEYNAAEELGRLPGFWWAPDGSRIVFEQADSSAVPRYPILHSGTPTLQVEPHRYPFAGGPNTISRLGVVPVAGGDVTWLSLGADPGAYLARVDWTPDDQLVVQTLARDQQHLTVRRIDPLTGEGRTLFEEHVTPWINLSDDLRFIRQPDAAAGDYTMLWSSERTGWRELYLYDRDGALIRQLTNRDAYIDCVTAVDAAGGWVTIQGWKATPLEQQFFLVPLDGGSVAQLTQDRGPIV
jgi:dipeptidyl-peptidase 4